VASSETTVGIDRNQPDDKTAGTCVCTNSASSGRSRCIVRMLRHARTPDRIVQLLLKPGMRAGSPAVSQGTSRMTAAMAS